MLVIAMTTASHTHEVDLEVALEFVNTLALERGEPVEHLETAVAGASWLQQHGLLHDGAAARVRDDALTRIRQTRAALRELVDAAHEDRAPSVSAIDQLNEALRVREITRLVASADGIRLDHRHTDDPIGEALAHLADPIVREVTSGRRDRLRACANDGCRWVFYDASPTGRRRWCDMSSCGNRAKAARHRVRVRKEREAGHEPAGEVRG
jgi:predicted RNA-binding Zn ribbon-like protein